MGKSVPVPCGVTAPCSWVLVTQGFVGAFQECVSPVLYKFWQLYGGLMATSSKRAYAIPYCTQSPCPHSSPLLMCASSKDTQTQFCLSLCGVSGSWCTQGIFESSEHLWQVWGLILNAISPLLPSCWVFSFALGCRVSFFGGIQHSPVDSCSAAICNFGVLTGEDEHISFYSAIL